MKTFFDLRESLQQVDEISSATLSNYSIKAANPANHGKNGSKAGKRIAGQWMADQKARKKDGYSSDAKVAAGTRKAQNESIENLSHSRLKFHAVSGVPHGSYTNKEIAQEVKRRRNEPEYKAAKASMSEAKKLKPGHNAMVLMKNLEKIKGAIKKEEVEDISEISQKMKDRYLQRSQSHWQHMSAVARDSGTDQTTREKLRAKMKKRNQGMARAYGQTKDNW